MEVSKEVLAAKVQDVSNGNWWFNPKDGKPDPFWATLVERCGKVRRYLSLTLIPVFLHVNHPHIVSPSKVFIYNVAPFPLCRPPWLTRLCAWLAVQILKEPHMDTAQSWPRFYVAMTVLALQPIIYYFGYALET